MFHAMLSALMPPSPRLMGICNTARSSIVNVRLPARHDSGVYLVGNGAASADVLDTITARVLGAC